MKRAAASALGVLMFGLCGASTVVWILCLDKELVLQTNMSDGDWLTADHGKLIYSHLFHHNRLGYYPGGYSADNSLFNFQWDRSLGGAAVAIPFWFPALLFLVTGMVFVMHGSRKEFARGFCQECGYDLRASKDRCPECGTQMVV